MGIYGGQGPALAPDLLARGHVALCGLGLDLCGYHHPSWVPMAITAGAAVRSQDRLHLIAAWAPRCLPVGCWSAEHAQPARIMYLNGWHHRGSPRFPPSIMIYTEFAFTGEGYVLSSFPANLCSTSAPGSACLNNLAPAGCVSQYCASHWLVANVGNLIMHRAVDS